MTSPLAPTDCRRYSVELRLYDTSNSHNNPDPVSLADVPFSAIQLWIAEFGPSSIGPRPPSGNSNVQPPPAANLSSIAERSVIHNRGHSSTTFPSNDRIRVKQGLHRRHCKQCFESGFRASSKKPIRTHVKKYHAEEFKVTLAPQGSRDQYRCCETDFDIDSWADHFVDRHCHSAMKAAPAPLKSTRTSSSFKYASSAASSSNPNGMGNPHQVTRISGGIGHNDLSNAESQRQASSPGEELLEQFDTPRSFGNLPTFTSNVYFPPVPQPLLQTLTPITPSTSEHDRNLLVWDTAGNVLFDGHDNKIVRTYAGQQAFAADGTCGLVRDGFGVPIPISFGQLLYAYPGSGDRITYRYGIDVL